MTTPEQRDEWAALAGHIDPEGPWRPFREALPALLAENAELRAALEASQADRDHYFTVTAQDVSVVLMERAGRAEASEQRLRDGITALANLFSDSQWPCRELRALLNPTERTET